MGPPQHGQGSRRVSGMISASGSDAAAGSGHGTTSRVRILAMFALQLELASSP